MSDCVRLWDALEAHWDWDGGDGFDPAGIDSVGHEYPEPCGSCEWCGTDLHPHDGWNELCDQCAYHASLNEGCDDAGGDGWMVVL